jgi:hypothetical protein
MPLGRILLRPSGIVLAQSACAVRTRPSLALLGLGQSSVRAAHGLAGPASRSGPRALARLARRLCGGGSTGHGGVAVPRLARTTGDEEGGSPRAPHGGGKVGGPILGSHRPRRGPQRWLTEASVEETRGSSVRHRRARLRLLCDGLWWSAREGA